jgi:polysaccharide export outer membrane protein
MNRPKFKIKPLITIIVFSLLLSSCVTKKEIVYFQNAKDFETIVDTDTFTAKLKVGDILTIVVTTLNPLAAAPYNPVAPGGQGQAIDYLIDVEGNIDFPVLGKVKLLGLTVEEAKQLFKKKFEEGNLLKDPVIIIRLMNYRVTIEGAVGSPGVYPVTGERMSILEALASAGGLNIKARRDNILIIRDFNGTKTYSRVDITSKEIFNSPVFYLTQNDYVYVEPNNSGVSAASGDARVTSAIGITASAIGLVLIIISLTN